MRNLTFFVLIVMFSITINSQTYSNHYYKRKALFEKENDSENEIVFLGNSITEGGDWKKLFPTVNSINRGISGDITDGIIYRINEVVRLQPKKIFILIGTNDLARGKSKDYVVSHIQKILVILQKKLPNTQLYLQSVLPVTYKVEPKKFLGHKRNKELIVEVNKTLKKLAKKLNVKFIHLHRMFRNLKGDLKEKLTYDGLHLNKKGYQFWKKKIDKYVLK